MEVIVEVRDIPRISLLVAARWQVLGCGFSSVEAYWGGLLEAAKAPALYAPVSPPGSIRDDCGAQAKAKYPFLLSVVEAMRFLNCGKVCSEIWLSRKRLVILGSLYTTC